MRNRTGRKRGEGERKKERKVGEGWSGEKGRE